MANQDMQKLILHDIYQAMLNMFGWRNNYESGLRVCLSSRVAPLRQSIDEQRDKMQWIQWSFDSQSGAFRVYVTNDTSIGSNRYFNNHIIEFDTDPVIQLYVDTTSCDLTLKEKGGNVIQTWNISSTKWGQVNDETYVSRGFLFGEYCVHLLGYLPSGEFGNFARETLFGEHKVQQGRVGRTFTKVNTSGEKPDPATDSLGRGALFLGAYNNYKFGVDESGRLCLWQAIRGLYTLVERF